MTSSRRPTRDWLVGPCRHSRQNSTESSRPPFSSVQTFRVQEDVENSALVGAHTERIHTISFSTPYRCMATGSADGHITIWDLIGQQLHTIHLQVEAFSGVRVASRIFCWLEFFRDIPFSNRISGTVSSCVAAKLSVIPTYLEFRL